MLTTPRLTLTPQTLADAPALLAILSDPAAMRFWNRPPITRLAVVEEMAREQLAAMAAGTCRYFTVRESGDAIGSVDLSLIEDGGAELGFLFRSDRWGQGLATEAVQALTAYGFGELGLDRLAAAVQTPNRAAARVLEKAGFALVRAQLVRLAGGTVADCSFYVLRRTASQAAKGA